MSALVVYESVYGNTRAIAQAIAEAFGDAEAIPVHLAPDEPDVDLLIAGGPTHMHGMSTATSRRQAVSGAREDGAHVEPGADQEPGLRAWIAALPVRAGGRAATFDTRLDRAAWLTGVASRGIAHRLHRRGYEIIASESFLVSQAEGPLEPGELERAGAWGRELAASDRTAEPLQ